MVNCAATTSKARGKHGEGLTALALQLCEQLQIPVIARNNKGIPAFRAVPAGLSAGGG